jgi:hypothetical protein
MLPPPPAPASGKPPASPSATTAPTPGSGTPSSGSITLPGGQAQSPPVGTTPPAPGMSPPAGPSALANRVMAAVAQIQDAPPPAHILVELPGLDGLQVRVSLSGSTVHLTMLGESADPAMAPKIGTLVQDVATGLSGRGMQLDVASGGRHGQPEQQPPPSGRPDGVAPPRASPRSGPPARPQPTGLRI